MGEREKDFTSMDVREKCEIVIKETVQNKLPATVWKTLPNRANK